MKTDYKSPFPVTLLYGLSGVLVVIALMSMAAGFLSTGNGGGGSGGVVIFSLGLALGLFIVAYLLDVLSHILHELRSVRGHMEEGTFITAPTGAEAARRETPVAESPAPVRENFEYFLMDNEKSTGPFPLKVLLNRLRMGTLGSDARVQRSGSANWVTLSTLSTLSTLDTLST